MIISLDKYKATGGGSGGSHRTEYIYETGIVYSDGVVYNPAWEIQPVDFFNGNESNYIKYNNNYFINYSYVYVEQPLKLTNTYIYPDGYKKQIWNSNDNSWHYILNNDNYENVYDYDLSMYTSNLFVRNDNYEIIKPHILSNYDSEFWDNIRQLDSIFPLYRDYNNELSDENLKNYFTKIYYTNNSYQLVDRYNNDTYIDVSDQQIWQVGIKVEVLPYLLNYPSSYAIERLYDNGVDIIGCGLNCSGKAYDVLDGNKLYVKDASFNVPRCVEYVVPYFNGFRKDEDIVYDNLSPYGYNVKNFINYRPDSDKIYLNFYGSYIGYKIVPTTEHSEINHIYIDYNTVGNNCQIIDFGNCVFMHKVGSNEYVEISADNIFSGCKALKQILNLDTSNVTNMRGMFSGCSSLTSIPQLDTSKVTNMGSMFSGCSSLTSIPRLDTGNVTNMTDMFYSCSSLTSIPQLDTSNVKSMYAMFAGCTSLTSVPQLDASNVTDMEFIFANMYDTPLTDLGGFKNLSISVINGFIGSFRGITVESLMNIINNLATVSSETLTFGKANLAKLTPEQIAVATAKGWTLTA